MGQPRVTSNTKSGKNSSANRKTSTLQSGHTIARPHRDQIVLDTSVLLTDPDSIVGFPGCDVVLPITVIEELDSAKCRLDDQGVAARRVVRMLEEFRGNCNGDLRAPCPTVDDATIRVELNGLRLDLLAAHGLKVDRGDNRILAAALGLRASSKSVTVVSVDVNMRVKAAALGLSARDWLPGRGKVNVRPGWYEFDVPSALIDKVYAGPILMPKDFSDMHANEYAVLHAGSQSALCRVQGNNLVRVQERKAWGLVPRSKEQIFALDLLMDPRVPIVGLSGPAGTGKTIVALAAALEQIFEPDARAYERLIILRPIQSVGRQDIGFLPGTVEEKLGPWFDAVIDALVALGDHLSYPAARNMVDTWVLQGSMSMDAVTYLRGRSFRRSFIIVDEAQNLEQLTLKTILTRVGEGSKVVFLGDVSQIDNPYVSSDSNALSILADRMQGQELFGHLYLTRGERSPVATLAASVL